MEEMNVHDYMQEVKDRFKAEWPEARMVYFVSEKKVNNDDTGNTYSCGRVTGSMGDEELLDVQQRRMMMLWTW